MDKQMFLSCPVCDSNNIQIHKTIITHFEIGEDNIKAYAFCQNCGHRGLGAFGRFTDQEILKETAKLWNEVRK